MKTEDIDYKKESILIVDDDSYLRETLEKLLEILGFSTEAASSGTEALACLKQKEHTFVLTDMKMPGMDGLELIQHIMREFDLNIIAMTGYTEGYKYVDVINAGASDFIKKPFGIEELEAKIRRILTERNLRKELNRLSITDSLTGLYNQRHFYARLHEEVTRSHRQQYPLSLILLDLDDFKVYNDSYGHLAGDDVLRNTGSIINSFIREGVDSGYRYGGDEFAIILVDADMNIAQDIGARIIKAFQERGKVGISLGYAIFSSGMTVKDLVSKADKDLYYNKSRKVHQ